MNKDFLKSLEIDDNDINEFLANYFVEDLVSKNTKILFLLESPDICEISSKFPAAGSIGFSMSEILSETLSISKSVPLGKYIYNNLEQSICGIMNCCQIPMQKVNDSYLSKDLLKSFKTIRNTKKIVTKRKNEDTEYVDNYILNDLKTRMNLVINDNKIRLIIPCGVMAQYFWEKIKNKNSKIKTINNIPHPSYNNWKKKTYKSDIEIMLKEINRII